MIYCNDGELPDEMDEMFEYLSEDCRLYYKEFFGILVDSSEYGYPLTIEMKEKINEHLKAIEDIITRRV